MASVRISDTARPPREAVAALRKAADALLALPNLDEKARQALAKDLQNKSAFYEKYAPAVDAVLE